MINPVKFKKILISLFKVLVVIELVTALSQGMKGNGWARFGIDLVIAGILYLTWERLSALVAQKREESWKAMATSPSDPGLFNALVFSLLWTDRIYENLPADRLRLIVISYTLIALGLVTAFMNIGTGLMPLVISGALVLGAVNLVTWLVSLERGEKETLQTELKLAHDVQVSLMPKSDPTLEGFDIAGISIPATNVGGDLFDYSPLGANGNAFGISVFDVSGKGMQAAMSAVFTIGALAGETGRSTSPGQILTVVNKSIFAHSRRGHFVAFLLAAIDPAGKTVTFANAGQTRPLLRKGAGLTWVEPPGVRFPLGMTEDSAYEERTVQLASGDVLLMLTDGFTEAMNTREEMFGAERVEEFARDPAICTLPAAAIIERLTAAVRTFSAGAPQHDDMTIVVVKVR